MLLFPHGSDLPVRQYVAEVPQNPVPEIQIQTTPRVNIFHSKFHPSLAVPSGLNNLLLMRDPSAHKPRHKQRAQRLLPHNGPDPPLQLDDAGSL